MAVTFACFHSSGILPFVNVFWNRIFSGLSNTLANSLRVLECKLSGPDNLAWFNFINFFLTSCSIVNCFRSSCTILFCIVGMSPNFSFVKTLVKKLAKISAFLLSLLVRVLLGVSKLAIPQVVFILLFTYCQNIFRFVFASFVISFSWHFCQYLVTFLTLFLSLLNITNLFSSI